jgi:hypothetical protein
MISYWKNYWLNFVACIFHIFLCFYFLATEQDLEGVLQLILAIYWIGSSVIAYNSSNILELNKRLKKVEEHAITDLDPEGNGNYIARRRCGPDKDVPYPGEEPSIEERIKKTDQDVTYFKAAMEVCGIVPGKSSTVTLTGEQLREFADKIMEDKK